MIKALLNPLNWKWWLIFCLVVKLVQAYLFLPALKFTEDQYYVKSGDSPYYIDLAQKIASGDDYYLLRRQIFSEMNRDIAWDANPDGREVKEYASRMPGYPLFLATFMLVAEQDMALNIVVLLQFLMSVVAIYLLARLMLILTKNKYAFYATLLLALASAHLAKYSFYIMAEAASISLLIGSLYFMAWVVEKRKFSPAIFLTVGILATIAILMRPFFLPFIGLMVLYLIYLCYKEKKGWLAMGLFLLPMAITETAWVARNFAVTGKFIPLESSTNFYADGNKVLDQWYQFTVATGGNKIFWEQNSMGSWMLPDEFCMQMGIVPTPDGVLPNWVLNDTERLNQLKQVKKDYLIMIDREVSLEERLSLQEKSIATIKNIREDYKEAFPIRYYLISKLEILWKFMYEPIDMPYKSMKFPFNAGYAFLGSAVNTFINLFGAISILGIVLVNLRRPKELSPVLWLAMFIAVFILLLFPFVYGLHEHRHLTYAYPFLLFSTVYFLVELSKKSRLLVWSVAGTSALACLAVGIHFMLTYIKW